MLQPRNRCLPWTHHLTSLCFQTGLCLLRVEWHFPDLRLGLKSIVPNSCFFSLVWTLGSCTQSSSSHAARSRKVVAPWAKQHKLVYFSSRIYKWSKFLSLMGTLADFLSFPIVTFTDVLASVLALYLAVNLYFFSPPTPHICGHWSDVPKRTGHEAMIQQLRCSEEPPWVLVACQTEGLSCSCPVGAAAAGGVSRLWASKSPPLVSWMVWSWGTQPLSAHPRINSALAG